MSGTYRNLIIIISDRLEKAGIENFSFEARELMAAVLNVSCHRAGFEKALDEKVSGENAAKLLELCDKRIKGEPLQYLIGEWEFYGLPFKVGEGVLIPRQDTETLIDIAAAKFKGSKDLIVFDLCAGSGCLGIAAEKNLSCKKVSCVELSDKAIKYLEINKRLNNSAVEIIKGDVLYPDSKAFDSLRQADLILCNPPYLTDDDMNSLQKEVSFEPSGALYGGEDGLDFYRGIVRLWKSKLRQGGTLIFEIGIGQEQEVMQLLIQHGFCNVRAKKDLCGVYRAVVGEKS